MLNIHKLTGIFPTGIPVLIHNQFDKDSLETEIGLIIKCHDFLNLAEIYCGRISAVIIKNSNNFYISTNIDHLSKRNSACYWVYLQDYQKMIDDFKNSWNSAEVKEKIDYLICSIYK